MSVRRLNEEFDERDLYYVENLEKICKDIPDTAHDLGHAMIFHDNEDVDFLMKKLRQKAEYIIDILDDITPLG